ncbi:MAG: tetratricopeptide repeat protein [Nitrospirae bacterium]|nr:tetratricopeptide repeat protein [Nitrospirota bacterium]
MKESKGTDIMGGIAGKPFVPLLLIAIIGSLAYSNTFSAPFAFDDFGNLADPPLIKSLNNFFFPEGGYKGYLPRAVAFFTFALNYHFGGFDVAGYHAVNLVIHITNALLVYFLVVLTFRTPYIVGQGSEGKGQGAGVIDTIPLSPLKLRGDEGGLSSPRFIALFSALIFVAHPVQTQAVTYIVQRLTSLAAMFYLFSMVMYVKARLLTAESRVKSQESDNPPFSPLKLRGEGGVTKLLTLNSVLFYSLSLLCAVLAMLTKEMSFTLPIMIILYEFTFFRSSLKKKLLFLLPLLLTLTIIPLGIMGTEKPLGEVLSDLSDRLRVQTRMSRWDYLFTQFRVITTYIRLLLLPVNQNLDYDYPVYHSFFTPPVFLSFLLLLSIFGVAVYVMRKAGAVSSQQSAISNNPPLSPLNLRGEYRLISFGIFWFFIALSVESSFIPIVDVIFEHRVYLPSVGAFIAVTAALFLIANKISDRRQVAGRALISALAAVVIAFSGATYARNIVWQSEEGLWEDIVRKSPNNARAWNNLGYVYLGKGLVEDAAGYFKFALRLNNNYADAHTNLGVAYYGKGLTDNAIRQFQMALKLSNVPALVAKARHNLGIAYSRKGMLDDALRELGSALRTTPDDPEIYSDLGVTYMNKGQFDKAIEAFRTALKLKPDYDLARLNLGIALKLKGRTEG